MLDNSNACQNVKRIIVIYSKYFSTDYKAWNQIAALGILCSKQFVISKQVQRSFIDRPPLNINPLPYYK